MGKRQKRGPFAANHDQVPFYADYDAKEKEEWYTEKYVVVSEKRERGSARLSLEGGSCRDGGAYFQLGGKRPGREFVEGSGAQKSLKSIRRPCHAPFSLSFDLFFYDSCIFRSLHNLKVSSRSPFSYAPINSNLQQSTNLLDIIIIIIIFI